MSISYLYDLVTLSEYQGVKNIAIILTILQIFYIDYLKKCEIFLKNIFAKNIFCLQWRNINSTYGNYTYYQTLPIFRRNQAH